MTKFSCFLIGSDTLLIECAQILLDEGHDIRGIITDARRVRDFCGRRDIPCHDSRSDYVQYLSERSFDYLFAITHLAIIPDDALALPKGMAINFHDGPLPRYAGLNAPVWALINQEQEYGVTWHEITSGVDEGDILEQAVFEVAPDETALSLNTKCMAAALGSFPDLVASLASGSTSRVKQDLSKRSYFGRFDRPKHGGLIDWEATSLEIEALVRALTFGPYPNPVGVPKTRASSDAGLPFVVTSIEISEEAAPAGPEPGAVLAAGETGIRVATGDGVVVVTGVRTLAGGALTTAELGLEAGDRLVTVASDLAMELTNLDKKTCRHERFWRDRLADRDPPELPFASAQSATIPDWRTLEWASPAAAGHSRPEIIAALAIYLARVGPTESFRIDVVDSAARAGTAAAEAFYSDAVPLAIDLDPTWTPRQVVDAIHRDLEECRARERFPLDLLQRDPMLAGTSTATVRVTMGDVASDKPIGSAILLHLDDGGQNTRLMFDGNCISPEAASGLLDSISACLEGIASEQSPTWTEIRLVTEDEFNQLVDWNATDVEYDRALCVHQAFESQVDRTPDAKAVVFEGSSLSYRELDERANRLARHLRSRGVGRDSIVGVHVARSLDLLVATLGVMKAGGAYLPLDPAFPPERLTLMMEDSGAQIIVTQEALESQVASNAVELVRIDADSSVIHAESSDRLGVEVSSGDLAYVIYTSGSTGRPKGVLVEHRNVVNFFTGMDEVIEHDPPGVWLAVTSLSFDISVLELFWTLARGFKVVVYADSARSTAAAHAAQSAAYAARPMGFGLFMWGNDDGPGPDKYRLMLEGAKFCDRNGFDSVWTPERHFHAFGGPFPNPSVTSAAIAAVTDRIAIRSGSCVSPLHHPIRVAEEWAVVDNLSGGRVGISFAAGWQPNDFVIRPDSFPDQKKVMFEQIETIRRLWRGEAVEFENPLGQMVEVSTLPRPVQAELPFWVTTAGNPDSYRAAGALGANVLTHLLGQTLDEVKEKIDAYRHARAEAGFDPDTGIVTLMLHAFVGDDDAEVREIVRQPMKDYLGASMKLVLGFAWSFPAFKRPGGPDSTPDDLDLSTLSDEESDAILDFAFERYFETSGLFGTVQTCQRMVDRCKGAGVDEIACLLDFGVDTDLVMASLPGLKSVRDAANVAVSGTARPTGHDTDESFAAQVTRYDVSHLQCTPSMLRLLLADPASRAALGQIRHFMIGGEAFPAPLAEELASVAPGSVTNMYGPTETTIWSSTERVGQASATIPIGRPIANTQLYVLDKFAQPLPVGIPGELFIGGDGVTRGYHEREALTADRFVADLFRGGGKRMYRTGDLTFFRPDGVVEFLGRADHQIKIRGYRVELGEIESVVEAHSHVAASAVVLREDQPGDQRLVAYVVPSNSVVDEGDLGDFVRQRLPDYMAPAHYVQLTSMPLTPNGKTDRLALASRTLQVARPNTIFEEEPEGDLERSIAAVWRELLRVESIGAEDNFFDVGGHSLLVVQLHRRLAAEVDKPISLVDLYRFPTIRALAGHLTIVGPSTALEESGTRAGRRKAAMGRRARGGRNQSG